MTEEEIKKSEVESEDYEFDFSEYDEIGQGDNDEREDLGIHREIPRLQHFRSRWSPWELEFERLAELMKLSSKLAIQASARTQNTTTLWKFYGVLDELWTSIQDLQGSIIQDQMIALKKKCRQLLEKHAHGNIPSKVHNNLLHLRRQIYRLKLLSHLSFDIEAKARSDYERVKKRLV